MSKDMSHLGGWIDDPKAVEEAMKTLPFPVVGDCNQAIKDTGRGKTVLLYKYVEEILGGFNVRKQAIGDCLKADAKVTMHDGSKKDIQDVEVGDYVMTPYGNKKRVIDTIKKPYDENMVEVWVRGYNRPIIATPDHKVITMPNGKYVDHDDKDKVLWKEIGKLSCDDYLLLPKLPNCNDAKVFDMKEFCQDPVLDCADFKKLRLSPVPKGMIREKGSYKNINRYVALDEKLGWLIGLYAAEGGCCENDNGVYRVTFNCGSHETLIIEQAKQYINDVFGVEATISNIPSKPTVTYVRIASQVIARLFKHLVNGNTYTKKLHNNLLLSQKSIKLQILKGWFDGDGHFSDSSKSKSVSEDLVQDMFELCKSCDISARIGSQDQTERAEAFHVAISKECTTKLLTKPQINLQSGGKYLTKYGKAVKVKEINIVSGPKFVYCLNVEDDHSFVADGFGVHNCVSFGSAGAIDCLKAFEIKRLGQSEEWVAETSTEDIYGGSRVVVGNGRLGNGDGSLGVWAAKWVSEYGTLVRKDYGEFDLTTYSGPRAKSWGYRGFPKNEVMKYCKEYPVQTVSRVSTYEEARDLLANGYPVTIAGTLGFSNIRDEDGFSRPSGSWAHMMFLAAVDDVGVDCKGGRHRPGVLVINSWGKWNGGPKRLGQPDGSFWISPEDLNRYFRNGDCWAYSDFKGYESKKINTWII